MKIDIPLTNVIRSLYSDYGHNKVQYRQFCNLFSAFNVEEEGYGISDAFTHGTALQGKLEAERNMNKYKSYLDILLTMHDNWNNIDPEVEEIKQKFYGEENE